MEFKGKIIFLIRDRFNCVHFYKKASRRSAKLNRYIEYIQSLEKKLGDDLIKSYIVNKDDYKSNYVWCSNPWRTDLTEKVSPNHQKYIDYLTEHRNNVKFIGPYKAMRTKGLHLCRFGHEWRVQPHLVKKGETCEHCKKNYKDSHGARYITELLVENKVEFIKEISLKRFGLERELRLDFLICQNNYPLFVIEFNGIQHYKPLRSEFFGGYKKFKDRKILDRTKRSFCWNMGLPVIDIPYTETESQIKETVLYFLRMFELIDNKESTIIK
ncbi:hypothetical protein [Priestia megaterium]|uniref:hypothetical protein n=1 Tax=Priestia megaterium TaxID=1404 RepID=UPI00189D4201|nr:hypothetical protein [Priestia megaterium]